MGPIESKINDLLSQAFAPVHLEVLNESSGHRVPKGSESHFRVLVVSAKFAGLSRIDRQRLVNGELKDLLAPGGVHALAQQTLTPEEWAKGKTAAVTSPPCLGGSKQDELEESLARGCKSSGLTSSS